MRCARKWESAHEKKYLRVAIYLRLSDEDKDKANKLVDSESIKNQRNLRKISRPFR